MKHNEPIYKSMWCPSCAEKDAEIKRLRELEKRAGDVEGMAYNIIESGPMNDVSWELHWFFHFFTYKDNPHIWWIMVSQFAIKGTVLDRRLW